MSLFSKIFSRRIWLTAAAIVAAALLVRFFIAEEQKQPAGTAARPQPVRVATVLQSDLDVLISGIGTVTAESAVTVRTRVDGQLMRLHFVEGQMVKAGDLLAEIDPRPYEVQLTQAKGQLAKDQALLINARQDLARYNLLRRQESVSQQQVDSQQSLVRQYEAAIKIDQGQIDAAQLQLTYSKITAPIDGRLGLRLVDPGNMLHSTDTDGIVVITRVRPITVIFTITEQQVPEVSAQFKTGQPLRVEAWDREQKKMLAVGRLLTMDNLIDQSTGTLKLKGQFANEDDALFPNQFVNVNLLVRTLHGVLKVPLSAVQTGSRGQYVFVVENGKASLKLVKTGASENDMIHVTEGLKKGEIVVIDGIDRLREGSPVSYAGKPGADGKGSGKTGDGSETRESGKTEKNGAGSPASAKTEAGGASGAEKQAGSGGAKAAEPENVPGGKAARPENGSGGGRQQR